MQAYNVMMACTVSLLSDDKVDKIAAFDITNSLNLYDPRFGTAGSTEVICPVCNMRGEVCMGHHASLSLGKHMFHPLVYKDAEKIINKKCFKCFADVSLVVSKSKTRICPECQSVNHGDYVVYERNLSVAVRHNKKGNKYADQLPKGFLPDGYVISKILVPPIHLRTPENMEWPSDIHKLYEQLVLAIKSKNTAETISTYKKIVSLPNKKGIIGVLSGKKGIFRNIMMGKRVELSARAVIVGDPNLMLDEVAVPKIVSESIKLKVVCTKHNIQSLTKLAEQSLLWWENTEDTVYPKNLFVGMSFYKQVQNGDLVLINRQPSLSRFSLMCFRVRIRTDDYNVFGLHPQATAPFNADFDGDEMNIFFMSDKTEMLELCHLSKCITNGSSAIVQPVQDLVTGCYLMSGEYKSHPVSDSMWQDFMDICFGTNPGLYLGLLNKGKNKDLSKQGNSYKVSDIFHICIPEYDGSLLNKEKLASIIFKLNDQRALDMLHVLQLVTNRWLSTYGLTVPISSLVSDTPVIRHNDEDPDEFRERCHHMVIKNLAGTSLMNMIQSGAKGSIDHASHMAIAMGQQYILGRRGIFCNKSYSQGLTPDEFFGHQMAAREGVVSTGISTSTTGYLNRKTCKIVADLKLQYNGTVADKYGVSSFQV